MRGHGRHKETRGDPGDMGDMRGHEGTYGDMGGIRGHGGTYGDMGGHEGTLGGEGPREWMWGDVRDRRRCWGA